eukprot:GHVU01031224.1.p2 GENE.GHVU01031224.1~~GHVU01031224.1.p2  ORF type:complete len:168 (+),score=32.64 GHVU01031224.1:418-921(+)
MESIDTNSINSGPIPEVFHNYDNSEKKDAETPGEEDTHQEQSRRQDGERNGIEKKGGTNISTTRNMAGRGRNGKGTQDTSGGENNEEDRGEWTAYNRYKSATTTIFTLHESTGDRQSTWYQTHIGKDAWIQEKRNCGETKRTKGESRCGQKGGSGIRGPAERWKSSL